MEAPISNEFELVEEVRRLIKRAERGGISGPQLLSLRAVSEQMMGAIVESHHCKTSEVNFDDRRDCFRFKPQDAAVAIVNTERIPVSILDLGGRGVGIFSPQAIPGSSYLILEIAGPEGLDTYSCFTAFCREKEGGYRVGLRLLAKLPK